MRITFTTEEAARAVVPIWERHGFQAVRAGATIETDGPTLWAIPVIDRTIGLDQVESIILLESTLPRVPAVHEARGARRPGHGREAA